MNRKIIKDIDFQKNAREKLKIMGSSKEFLDVTLTSEDNISFQAHKVILAATSIVFRDNFNRNEGANYVIGVNSRFLASMLDIIYFGETKIEAES